MPTSKKSAARETLTEAPPIIIPTTTSKKKVVLPVARKDFWEFCRLAWGYLLAYRTQLAVWNASLTETFIEEQVAYVGTVENLPTLRTRLSRATDARNELIVKNDEVLFRMQLLKSFILLAWKSTTDRTTMYKAAGLDSYAAAQKGNWGSTSAMCTTAKQFMVNYVTALTGKGNMPSTFADDFDSIASRYNAQKRVFENMMKEIEDGTGTQEGGLQIIKDNLYPLMHQAAIVFHKEPFTQKKFIIAQVAKEVKSTRPAAAAGGVSRPGDPGRALKGVRVYEVEAPENETVTNNRGRYRLSLSQGNHTLAFATEGYEVLFLTVKLKAGTASFFDVVLHPLPGTEAEEAPLMTEAVAAQPSEEETA